MSSVDIVLGFDSSDVETIPTLECWELVVEADEGFGGRVFWLEESGLKRLDVGEEGFVFGIVAKEGYWRRITC